MKLVAGGWVELVAFYVQVLGVVIHVDAKHSREGSGRGAGGTSFIVVREHPESDGEQLQFLESLETLALKQRIGILAAAAAVVRLGVSSAEEHATPISKRMCAFMNYCCEEEQYGVALSGH